MQLVLFSWRPSHALPLFFILGSRLRHIVPLLVVVHGQVYTINTTIVTLDRLLLLDTHSHEFLKCQLLIHGVVVDPKGLKLLWQRVEDQEDHKSILDCQIKGLQTNSHVSYSQNVVTHTTSGVLLRSEPLNQSARI
jgi:hypothetical protein